MKPTKGELFLEAFNDIDDKYLKEAMNYTMKKRFNFKPIIAVAACAAFALAAVPLAKHFARNPAEQVETIGQNGIFTVYESGIHAGNNKLNAEHNIEFQKNMDVEFSVNKEKLNTVKTVEFGGREWTAMYQQTAESPYYNDDSDIYFGEIDGEQFVFYIDTQTGDLKSFNSSLMKIANEGDIYTKDESYNIAIDFLNGKVNNIADYTLEFSREVEWRNGYLFQFRRTLNGIMTSEYISIGVRNNGEIYSFSLHAPGSMDNVDASGINKELLNKAIDDKINSIYKNNHQIIPTEKEIILTRLADGSYIFDCEITIEGKATEKDQLSEDVCYLTVTID